MSQRLEVMLTSRRPDGVWTWRAAGARQPKGVMEAALLPADAAIGDILRVEAEISLDGIAVRQVLPTKTDKPPPPRVEHIGSQRFTEGVTGPSTSGRSERSERRRGDGGRRRHDGGPGRGRRDDGRPQRGGSGGRGSRDKPSRAPRLRAANTHRDAWLGTLSAEQKAVADRLVNEGIRAVRQSIRDQETAESGDQAPEKAAPVPAASAAVVEDLFTALRAADWRDRAEAARGVTDDVDLRDLRSVVAGTPDEFPDDEARTLAEELRGKLAARVDREHSAWIADLGSLIRKGRLITALRVSQRPPRTGTPLPESLAESLCEAAGSQLDADADDDLWVRMLEAGAQSPVRLVLVAGHVPQEPSERLLRTVGRFGDRLPALREQFAAHLDPPEPPAEPEASVDPEDPAAEPESPPAEPESSGEPEDAVVDPEPSREPENTPVEPDDAAGDEDGVERGPSAGADADPAEERGESTGEVEGV